MDGGESEGVRWALVGDIRRPDAGSGRHRDDRRVPLEVTFACFGRTRRPLGHRNRRPKLISIQRPAAFFDFQRVAIVSYELFDLGCHREELVLLLLVESDGEPAQPVDGNRTFFANFY